MNKWYGGAPFDTLKQVNALFEKLEWLFIKVINAKYNAKKQSRRDYCNNKQNVDSATWTLGCSR